MKREVLYRLFEKFEKKIEKDFHRDNYMRFNFVNFFCVCVCFTCATRLPVVTCMFGLSEIFCIFLSGVFKPKKTLFPLFPVDY